MKKTLIILGLFLGLLFFPKNVWAQEEIIRNYQVDIFVNQDSSVDVEEAIEYDFGQLNKHGIYRDIPLSFSSVVLNQYLDIVDISVSDQDGNVYDFVVSQENGFKHIKIGNPNITISGTHQYFIKYKVRQSIKYKDEYDEFYWNAIGADWQVPILNSEVNVHLWKNFDKERFSVNCYYGYKDATSECSALAVISNTKSSDFRFRAGMLKAHQGVTVLLKLDKGLIAGPSSLEKFFKQFIFYFLLILPLIVLVLMFLYWLRSGRDPKGRGTIIAQYDAPKDLMPAEAGTVLDEHVQSRDISAEIILLATLGYIKITRVEKSRSFSSVDYLLEKLKEETDLPREYQKELMANLFSSSTADKKLEKLKGVQFSEKALAKVLISDFKNKAYKWIKVVEKGIYQSVVDKRYFLKNPKEIRNTYGIILFVTIFFASFFGSSHNFLTILSFALSLIIVVVFGYQMPRRTKEGVLMKEYILGLKDYINVAEKDRIAFHNAPEKNPELFEKLLPYAMALGVEKKWAQQFEGIYTQEPNWYHGGVYGAHFSATSFGSSLSSFSNSSASTLSSSSSGGGGGVGGGGGGGGGGSW